jgi:gamma-D-glutamyl-L-lysine dipeptidyl-peptidase
VLDSQLDRQQLAVNVTATTLWVTPDAPRDVDAPMLAAVPDPHAWATTLTREQKLDLFNRVHSQLLLGEPVVVVEERGDWLSVVSPWQPSDKDPDGYPGWVRREHLAAPAPATADREVVVAVEATSYATAGGSRVASYGTVLPVASADDDTVRVALPGGEAGKLRRSACVLAPVADGHRDRPVSAAAVLATARRFAGLDYLWGGTSAYGLDCSGLVHLSFRALGKVVPRDGHDQATAAQDVPLADARAGDLLFFARPGRGIHHVGFCTGRVDGELQMLHAPGTGNPVVEEPLNADRQATLLPTAGRLTTNHEPS